MRGYHQTLGPQLDPNEGTKTLHGLFTLGLLSTHKVADYGCGRLRTGRHLIAFLDPGNYYGLDVTEKFFSAGVAEINEDLVTKRKPHFYVIDRQTIQRLSEINFDFVLLEGVLQCVPPSKLKDLVGNLSYLCAEHTRVIASLLEAPKSIAVGTISFRHSIADIASAARAQGLQVHVIQQGIERLAFSKDQTPLRAEHPETPPAAWHIIQKRGFSPEALNQLGSPSFSNKRATIIQLSRISNING